MKMIIDTEDPALAEWLDKLKASMQDAGIKPEINWQTLDTAFALYREILRLQNLGIYFQLPPGALEVPPDNLTIIKERPINQNKTYALYIDNNQKLRLGGCKPRTDKNSSV